MMNKATPNFNEISFNVNCGNCGSKVICTLKWEQFFKAKYKKHEDDPCDSWSGFPTCNTCGSVIDIIMRIVFTTYSTKEEMLEATRAAKLSNPVVAEKTTKMVKGDQSLI